MQSIEFITKTSIAIIQWKVNKMSNVIEVMLLIGSGCAIIYVNMAI